MRNTPEKKLRFIDLFAGIGGFHLAFHNAGAECVFASEWNPEARKVYEANFAKHSKNLFKNDNFAGDITEINPRSIPDFDILCAGFPCQPFSQAGFKKGFEEARGTLFFEISKIIREKKPQAFFLENVRHLLNHDGGNTYRIIEKIIREDLNYSLVSKVVKASDFGLPQHRPRLFMVGFKNREIEFAFPDPQRRTMTMSDVWQGACDREIGYTLRVGGRGSGIDDRRNWDSYRVDGKVRKIGPSQGKKMQGFPDDFALSESTTQAMKQLGNSVAVPAVESVARSMINLLNR